MKRHFVVKSPASKTTRLSSPASVHEQLALLNEASRRVGSTLDLVETARELIDVAVPRFADAGAVLVADRLVTEGKFPVRSPDGSARLRRIAVGTASGNAAEFAEAFPADEVLTYPSWTPYARAMTTAKPIMLSVLDAKTAREISRFMGRDQARKFLERASLLAAPLQARGRILGVVVFARHRASPRFTVEDVTLAEELAARTAMSLDNARLYHRERRTALTLQSSLLPAELQAPLGLDVASRYLPASDLTGVGGDWYDVIPLPGGRAALVVGDVMGHGTRAAATMGQLRTAARTLAALDLNPAEALLQLSRMSQDLDATQIATCLYATYDPVTRTCAMARAGHVPPILLYPDGLTEVIDLPPGLPLGIGSDPFQMREIMLPVGGVLALYTDGLVESRDRDIDEGIGELRNLLSVQLSDLDDICEATISAQRAGHERDDIALLLARVRELSEDQIAIWTLPAEPASVGQARRLVRDKLADWNLSCLKDTTELIISELVTNAVSHGWAPIQLRLVRGRTLVCEVTDSSPMVPMLRTAREDDDSGRGLQLINWLSYRWGTRPTATGKVVWVEQRLPESSVGDS